MNIPTSSLELSSGSEVMPYLQPLPLRGTGFHRFIFSLFTHSEPLDLTTHDLVSPATEGEGEGEEGRGAGGERGTWLEQRTFSTSGFIERFPQVEPFSFAMFQSQWDNSVQHMFSNVLGILCIACYTALCVYASLVPKTNRIFKSMKEPWDKASVHTLL